MSKRMWMLIVLGLVVLALVAFAVWVRLAPNDTAVVHRDPMAEGAVGANMAYTGPPDAPDYEVPPERLFEVLDGIVMGTPRVEKVAEGPDAFHASYIARTALWGFPDYVSLRVIGTEQGATYAIWSRSRFGSSDMGANGVRIAGWREELAAALGGP